MRLARLVPLLLILAALAAAWASGLTQFLSWQTLARHHATLRAWIGAHTLQAGGLYLAIYAAATALSLPAGALLTASGGLFFGVWVGGCLAVTGATIGAVLLYLSARLAAGETMDRRGGSALASLRRRLSSDGFLYLLAIRLVPLFPFWMVNLAAALGGVRPLPYVAATFLGIIPVGFILASIGAGLGDGLAQGQTPDLSILLSPRVLLPLAGLAVLALLPLLLRGRKGKRA